MINSVLASFWAIAKNPLCITLMDSSFHFVPFRMTKLKVVLFNYICVGMNNFRFTKIVASVSPILAKETVLSKIINMVDAFTLTLSRGFDDNNKKYIDTLMKLDNSKTVILETKWNEVRIKNIGNFVVKEWQKVVVEYSEYTQENEKNFTKKSQELICHCEA